MAFTTWTALYNSMLDDMADGNWRVKSYEINNRSTTYRSFTEFKSALEYVRTKAADEAGTFAPRVYAKQGGRG